jgi:PHD/YefM family antitoxin component YafN of YafNO toxin-antitoxin module
MQTLPAQELKRRGLAAIDPLLPHGPVHVLRNNRPAAVVLSPEAYQRLAEDAARGATRPDIWSLIERAGSLPSSRRTRKEIDAALKAERDSWDRD